MKLLRTNYVLENRTLQTLHLWVQVITESPAESDERTASGKAFHVPYADICRCPGGRCGWRVDWHHHSFRGKWVYDTLEEALETVHQMLVGQDEREV